ncbi:MAG TPA: ABC transporter ATP-binding protein [Gemmatimonadaceae bacterium]|jgi:ABC-2 type transport system ATP-binding protein|nr:ABC transporter ATP-binding protein [Gemmatimonadaceae bacterium]
MTLAVETQGLRYQPGKSFALADLSLHVPEGAIYGFLGPNGAGKTTTLRLLLGLLRPQGGTIRILGRAMPGEYVDVLARTGYVPERPHLDPTLSVAESMELHAAFHRRWDAAWATTLQQQFRLRGDARVGALSKGETGKLMMLLALAQQPELLVLDEPTDGLDPVVRRDVLEAVLEYVSERRATVLISSHLVHELERICDWVGVLDRGRLVAEMPMEDFKNGIKRLLVRDAPSALDGAPFTLLTRKDVPGVGEQWLVRGWAPGMREFLEGVGATVTDVVDLDLEDGFVEMLRSFRDNG